MWTLEKPPIAADETYRKCISRIRNKTLKERLAAFEGAITQASNEYDEAAEVAQLSAVVTPATLSDEASREELIRVYTLRMAKPKSPGRPIYDRLLAAPPHGRCPLCGHRNVNTLDHHLPKSGYPALVVTPANLVPACMDCNKAKRDSVPATPQDVMLHPYFDDIERDRWLYAEVVQTQPASVRFFVEPSDGWDDTTAARVRRHFDRLKLGQLYSAQAGQELTNIRHYLTGVLLTAGAMGVRDHLLEQAESRRQAFTNSWQTAAYEAFSGSAWFCAGGFR